MWLRHDLGWWGAVLSIVALVLMIPANLLANLLTPILEDWWAGRSIATLEKRIERLEGILRSVDKIPPFTPFEHCVLYGLALLGRLVMSVASLIIWLVIVLSLWYELSGNKIPSIIFIPIVGLTALTMLVQTKGLNLLRAPLTSGTEKGRIELRASIERLKSKLAASGGK